MIFSGIRELCLVSILCGAALSLAPAGSVRQVTEILCACVLITLLINTMKSVDFDTYALQSAKLRQAEAEILQNAESAELRLNRLVIENEYRTYILDKAEKQGIALENIKIGMRWDLEGYWLPDSVVISSHCSKEERAVVGEILKDDLGIPYSRQEWADA